MLVFPAARGYAIFYSLWRNRAFRSNIEKFAESSIIENEKIKKAVEEEVQEEHEAEKKKEKKINYNE